MDRFSKLLNKITDNKIQPGDETTEANNPRNMLANAVNPLLDEYVNPVLPESVQLAIPKMTVADDKNFYQNLPEQMAGSAMGSIKAVNAAPRFQNLGKVLTKPTAQDLATDAAEMAMMGKPKQLKGADVLKKFQEDFADEIVKRKADKNAPSGAYDSWKQEMLNKIRRESGEGV